MVHLADSVLQSNVHPDCGEKIVAIGSKPTAVGQKTRYAGFEIDSRPFQRMALADSLLQSDVFADDGEQVVVAEIVKEAKSKAVRFNNWIQIEI